MKIQPAKYTCLYLYYIFCIFCVDNIHKNVTRLISVQLISNSNAKFCNNSAKICNKQIWLMAKEWDLKSTSQLKAVIKQRFQIASKQNKHGGRALHKVKVEFGWKICFFIRFLKWKRLYLKQD